MTTEFKLVVKKELEDVANRRKKTGGAEAGLPPLEDRLTEVGKGSKVLLDVLNTLNEDGQDDAWNDAIESKAEGAGSKAEVARNYAGHTGLVGLAFSGGGIRSATFNLGVLQALEKCGVLSSIDYLSTVSGGGYLGSCLSSLHTSGMTPKLSWIRKGLGTVSNSLKSLVGKNTSPELNAETAGEAIDFPFRHKQGLPEPVAFRHLRNNANFLAPKGFLDLLRAPAILLRGVLINLLVILPYILVASIVTVLINPNFSDLEVSLFGNWTPFTFLRESAFAGSITLFLLLVAAFALYPLALWLSQKVGYLNIPEWKSRHRVGRVFGSWIAVIAVVAFLEFQPIAILWFSVVIEKVRGAGIQWQDWFTMLGTVGSVLASLSAGNLAERVDSGLVGKLGIYLLGLLGFLLFWLVYLNLCRWAILYVWSPMELSDFIDLVKEMVPEAVAFLTRALSSFASLQSMEFFVSSAQYQLLSVYLLIALFLGFYTIAFVDVNYTSLHNFYRDRLSKAFLIRFGDDGDLEHNDTQKLSELNSETAPYHLINAAINLDAPKEAFRRGRQADTFLFSKHFIGGPPTDYCETTAMESARSHVNLGTAMAVSGAAFAATAGKATIKPLAFLMAMLNVRLNYWLPNPKFVARRGWWAGNTFNRAGPIYLVKELFGWLDANSWNVDISDGGHFENLGVYELLRRECRLIIAGDGECDPELKFEAVSELVRLAQIDMGIEIKMDGLDEIRAGQQHYAIGTIGYSRGRKGVLIYLKSSLLKDDALEASLPSEEAYLTSGGRADDRQYDSNPYIAHYKAKNPSFPHQTTGDQFFDEKQFECYRALGYMVAMRSIGDWKTPTGKKKKMDDGKQVSEPGETAT